MGKLLSEGDRLAIVDVILRYATSIDRRDWDLFRTCFTGDCTLDYGDIGSWRGIDDFTAYNQNSHLKYGATMHRMSNVVIEGSGDTATARTYVDAVLYSPEGQLRAQARGYYDDRLTMVEGDWKIADRRFTAVELISDRTRAR